MPWQKITRHISDERIIVQSKSGNDYPVSVKYKHDGQGLYSQMMNRAHDDYEYWGFVTFTDDGPVLEDWTRKPEGVGPPDKAPWDH